MKIKKVFEGNVNKDKDPTKKNTKVDKSRYKI